MKYPKVSVYVCVYNQENTIERCLNSILRQTYNNKEIVVINDGSTDKTGNILKRYSETCKILYQENKGLSLSRKKAIEECTGEYIASVDADDYVSKKWLEKAMEALLTTKANVAMMGFQSVKNNGSKLIFGLNKNYKYEIKNGLEVVELLSRDKLKNMNWGYVVKRQLSLNALNSFDGIQYYEDVATTYHIMLNAGHVVFVPGQYYFYVKNEYSITRSPSIRQVEDLEKIRSNIKHDLSSRYPLIVQNWNFHIFIMEYQIISLIGNSETKLSNLRFMILSNRSPKISISENLKLFLIKVNIYKIIYRWLKKAR